MKQSGFGPRSPGTAFRCWSHDPVRCRGAGYPNPARAPTPSEGRASLTLVFKWFLQSYLHVSRRPTAPGFSSFPFPTGHLTWRLLTPR